MSDTVYGGFRKDEMELHFNPRVAVPDFEAFRSKRSGESKEIRSKLKVFSDIAYGTRKREVMDIFPAAEEAAPVHIFVHGGYWRTGSKNDSGFVAGCLVPAGATTVILEYDLCPAVTVSEIVRQVRSGIAWVYRNIKQYGGDASRLYLSGSSAGGHLVAMSLAHDWERAERLPRDLIKGAVAMTGVY